MILQYQTVRPPTRANPPARRRMCSYPAAVHLPAAIRPIANKHAAIASHRAPYCPPTQWPRQNPWDENAWRTRRPHQSQKRRARHILNMRDERACIGALKNRHVKTVAAARKMTPGSRVTGIRKRADNLDKIAAGHNQAVFQTEMGNFRIAIHDRAGQQIGKCFKARPQIFGHETDLS